MVNITAVVPPPLQMKDEHQKILELVKSYLDENPNLRFSQALFNLNINQKPDSPDKIYERVLRDNYGDTDSTVLERITEQLDRLKS